MANCNTRYNNDKEKSIMELFTSTGATVGITIASILAVIGVLLFVKFVLMK